VKFHSSSKKKNPAKTFFVTILVSFEKGSFSSQYFPGVIFAIKNITEDLRDKEEDP